MSDTNHQIIAGAGAQVDVIVRRAPIEGDCDGEFKKALASTHADPKGSPFVTKAKDDTQELDLKRPEACTDLIKRAHSTGSATWNPFAESQDLAKAQAIAVGDTGRVVRVFHEHGETRFIVENA